MNEQHTRFRGSLWYQGLQDKLKEDPVSTRATVCGAGGIGSWTALALSRTGIPLIIYDDDKVEAHNLGGQAYMKDAIGKKKTDASAEVIAQFNLSPEVIGFTKRINEGKIFTPYMFSCFDSMKSRREAYAIFKEMTHKDKILIEGRLTAQLYEIYTVTAENQDEYEQYLFDDEEGDVPSCTDKQNTFLAMGIASVMVNTFTNHLTNIKLGAPLGTIPIKQYFHALTLSKHDNTD